MVDQGVYIGTDCEIVAAGNYYITYRRNSKLDFLESRLFRKEGLFFACIGICRTSPTETEQRKQPKVWDSAFRFHGKTVTKRQIMNEDLTGYTNETNDSMSTFIGSTIDIKKKNGRIAIVFEDGMSYSAVQEEAFTDLQPPLPDINDENIGECLRLWNMGINEEFYTIDGISTFIGVTINTHKHMYIFEMTPGSIYCRAARFAATNKGVVFNQNFRQGVEAYMIQNNSDARLPLQFDESNFSGNSCIWNDRSVYWSVVSYTDTEITLNGCQGELYHWKKPKRS